MEEKLDVSLVLFINLSIPSYPTQPNPALPLSLNPVAPLATRPSQCFTRGDSFDPTRTARATLFATRPTPRPQIIYAGSCRKASRTLARCIPTAKTILPISRTDAKYRIASHCIRTQPQSRDMTNNGQRKQRDNPPLVFCRVALRCEMWGNMHLVQRASAETPDHQQSRTWRADCRGRARKVYPRLSPLGQAPDHWASGGVIDHTEQPT